MAEITLKGTAIHTVGELPAVGTPAPDFLLTGTDLGDRSLKDYAGKKVLMNIFPSLDTPVCATSVRKFNEEAQKLENTVVLTVSMDLPFAHGRFCAAEGLEDVVPLSELRTRAFGEDYGVRITDGPMTGLFSRAIVIVDEGGRVIYTEQVPEIGQEPDYEKALAALK